MPYKEMDINKVASLLDTIVPEILCTLLRRQRVVTLEPGAFIYRQGDPADGLCILLSADVAALPQLVDVTWTNETTGRTLRLERLRAPALFGHVEVVQSGFLLRHLTGGRRLSVVRPRLTSVRAVTAIKLMRVPYSTIELLNSDEAIALAAALGRKAAEAFAGGLSVLHDAFVDDSTYRLAAWLRQETAVSITGEASGSTARTRPLKQEEIAKQIGLRRDTLNQKLKLLETSGVIAVLPSREIVVHDLERLDQLADLAIRTDFATFDTVRGTIADALLSGNAFRARNLALEAMGRFPAHPEIRHQAVLAMLRCGSFDEAAGLLDAFGWSGDIDAILASISEGYTAPLGRKQREELDESTEEDADEQERWVNDRRINERRLRVDIPALSARVAKDTAFATPGPNRQSFIEAAAQSAARYAAVADRFADPYCAVNAAAMSRLSNDLIMAENYARLAFKNKIQGNYWDHATRMESYLILGEREPALAEARAAASVEVSEVSRTGMIASTRLQLRRLTQSCGVLATELRDLLPQKRVTYITGHMPPQSDPSGAIWRSAEGELSGAIDHAYAEAEIGAVVCAIAAGSDLLLAERALAAEAALHVVLPVPMDVFLERSVIVGDTSARSMWRERFDAVMGQARAVTVLEEDKPVKARLTFDEAVFAGNRHAAGLALLRADEWESEAIMVCIHDGSGPGSIAGTSRIKADWQAYGHRAISLACSWREGRPPIPAETLPTCFGAVLFVWLALPSDHDRHQTKSIQSIEEHLERAEGALRIYLQSGEKLERRVLNNQMIGLYICLLDLTRAQKLAAALGRTTISGLDGLRIVLDFGGVFTGSGSSETRVGALLGARDNTDLPLDTVVLTEAFAAEARLRSVEPAPFSQAGLQSRKSGVSRMPRAAIRYYRGMSSDL